MVSANPFKNYELPETPKVDPAQVLRLQRKGDWFTIEVTEVGELFENSTYGGKNYSIKGKLVGGQLRDYENDSGEVYPAPSVGTDDLIWFQSAVSKDGKQTRDDRVLQAALKEKGVSSLVPGDTLSVALIEIKEPKQKGWKGERIRGFIVEPTGDRSTSAPFDFD